MAEMTQNEVRDENKPKKGLFTTLAVVGYVLLIVFFLTIAPVVCPPVFGYHTYLPGQDSTGLVSSGSVVYVNEDATPAPGQIAAYATEDSSTVNVAYVEAEGVAAGESVVGTVRAKTPIIGYFSQLCYSVLGIILLIIIFLAGAACTIASNVIARKEKKQAQEE